MRKTQAKQKIIAIAGGTGAGKSTICFALQDKYPDKISIVHLDDYTKQKEEAPRLHGMINWDHPDVININNLADDLRKLKNGEAIIVQTKDEVVNPDYKQTNKRITVEVQPKAVILLEGYLSLCYPEIRKLIDQSIFLDAGQEMRLNRRTKFKNKEYFEKVLIPMHDEHIEPTKKYADYVIEIGDKSREEIISKVEQIISRYL